MDESREYLDDTDFLEKREKEITFIDLKKSFFKSILLVLVLWIVKLSENFFSLDLSVIGLYPREIQGLLGVLFTPFIHSNFDHLFSNSFPLVVLATGLFHIYRPVANRVLLIIFILCGMGVWLFARPVYHIGASGILYGLVSFIFFSGILRKDTRSIALSLLVTFLYGSMVWGVLPLIKGVSWESHLSGSIAGIICAFFFRKAELPFQKKKTKYDDPYDQETEYWDDYGDRTKNFYN